MPGELGTLRKGKPGLKKYLLSKIRRVKEIFRKEKEFKDKAPEANDPVGSESIVPATESMPEPLVPPLIPDEVPDLVADTQNEILTAEASTYPRQVENQHGKTKVQWTLGRC